MEDDPPGSRGLLASQAFERIVQCVMAAMDKNPIAFAAFLPHFLRQYCNAALARMDAGTVHHMRSKRRVLLTRFLARALLCPHYNPAAAGPGARPVQPGMHVECVQKDTLDGLLCQCHPVKA